MKNLRAIAIHLPQFHPIAENDEWWGKGFTEWTNVTKASPLFKDHYQPHLPADLGFYDLRLEEARLAQEVLAKQYGMYGFCYYHYWFNGKRLLHEPLDRKLKNPKEDFPFMLCWANENWTRRWDGNESEILIKQQYSEEDDLEHINFLCEHFFKDERYIKVNGKPFFVFYKPLLFPDIEKTLLLWREVATSCGIEDLYVACMKSASDLKDYKTFGFDAMVEFEPDFNNMPTQEFPSFISKIKHRLGFIRSALYDFKVVKYEDYVLKKIAAKSNNLKQFPGITPGWDNSARKRKNGFIFKKSSPDIFEKWLKHIKNTFVPFSEDENFIFINAWNEWAEGNHLEPCNKWGLQYLEKIKMILGK